MWPRFFYSYFRVGFRVLAGHEFPSNCAVVARSRVVGHRFLPSLISVNIVRKAGSLPQIALYVLGRTDRAILLSVLI